MSVKKVIQLDENGYFIGLADSYVSPLEEGVWLLPKNSIDQAVPTIPDGYKAKWNGSSFVLEEIPVEVPVVPEPIEPLPITVTPWQMRKALNQLGLRDAIEAYVATADQTTKDGWEFATSFVENDAFVAAAQAALGMTDTDRNNLFNLARTL